MEQQVLIVRLSSPLRHAAIMGCPIGVLVGGHLRPFGVRSGRAALRHTLTGSPRGGVGGVVERTGARTGRQYVRIVPCILIAGAMRALRLDAR